MRKVHEGKTSPGVEPDRVFDVSDAAEPSPVTLSGELAAAYVEFQAAAADLEGKVKAADEAKMRWQGALGRFTRLAAGTGAGLIKPG